jgi:hypothetical protein
MSHDLLLHTKSGKPPLTPADFDAYFRERKNYKLDKGEAAYFNQDTGVYFSFNYSQPKSDKADPEETKSAPRDYVAFHMNYFRPELFALEADIELRGFVEHFDTVVDDPQAQGMTEGVYSTGGFLRSWNSGNRFAHHAILSMEKGPGALHTYPAARSKNYWRWNYQRNELCERIFDDGDGYDVFVPTVMFLDLAGKVQSFAIWPDALPTAVPAVDVVLIIRKEFAVNVAGQMGELALAEWAQFLRVTKDFELVSDAEQTPVDYVLLNYDSAEAAPAELVEFIRAQPVHGDKLRNVAVDKILDAELIRELRPDGAS